MNLTVETIEALRAQGVPAEAILDALQAALRQRIERDRERARLRQQKSRAARRPRRASSEPCHSDRRAPSLSPPKEVPPDPPKKYTPSNLTQQEPPSSAPAAGGEPLPADWKPKLQHHSLAILMCRRALGPEIGRAVPMFDDFLWRFAWRFCDQQASQFAGWARTWPRRSPDWDMRFSEWLRREFSDLRKAKDEPTLRPDQNMFAEPLSLSHAAACFEMGIEFDPDEA